MKEITKEWLKAAHDDLEVIASIIPLNHLTHIVAFHAQQCIEKSLKAVIDMEDLVPMSFPEENVLIGND